MPFALIDWDGAQLARPIDDLAAAAWHFVPLGPDEFLKASGFAEPFQTGRRLRVLCDAYGLDGPTVILSALSRVKQLWPTKLRYWQPIRPSDAAAHLRATALDLDWLEQNAERLRTSLA